MPKQDDKVVQQKYLELQMLDTQIKQLQQQLKALETQAGELDALTVQLDEMKSVQVGSEILIPVASGIFARAELKDNAQFLVNVGADTVVVKSVDDTKGVLARQVEDIRKLQQEMMGKLTELAAQAQVTQGELRKLIE